MIAALQQAKARNSSESCIALEPVRFQDVNARACISNVAHDTLQTLTVHRLHTAIRQRYVPEFPMNLRCPSDERV